MNAVRYLDRCLRHLYRLAPNIRIDHFLVGTEPNGLVSGRLGAVFVQSPERVENQEPDLEIGVYLHPTVLRQLQNFEVWKAQTWSSEQIRALSTACEEVSHFRYLCSRAKESRTVSQLEIELQGEVDRFFLFYLILGKRMVFTDDLYCKLMDIFFYAFQLKRDLPAEERERYLEANRLARNFAATLRKDALKSNGPRSLALVIEVLRMFYGLGLSEKIAATRSLK